MCKTPKAPEVKIPEPVVLRNPFLDETRNGEASIESLRTGRSALRIPLGSTSNLLSPRGGSASVGGTAGARGNGNLGPSIPLTTTPNTSIPAGRSGPLRLK